MSLKFQRTLKYTLIVFVITGLCYYFLIPLLDVFEQDLTTQKRVVSAVIFAVIQSVAMGILHYLVINKTPEE
ncbi:hypothetical protein [Lewinella sp. W8]|uniref:hypothetical protein n=1 Tax=Lewinella sp. W8 TaxID=2528208 RepID=UPI001067844A|nr:hypothetical protein [Lewinella sp. W8]MTB52696.1 hypothetical protein [Lewinella sp. W8]